MTSPPSSQSDAPSRRPRRWFVQISLRTLFVFLTLGCVWLAILSKRARDQQAAIARIRALGGHVQYDYEEEAQRARIANPTPPGWPWLRRAIGDDYFQTVVRVKLDKTKITDDDLRLIGKLRQVHTLSLNFTDVSDAGLAHVRDCRKVRYLGLAETKVTSAGVAHVTRMKEIEDLILQHARVDDRGVECLRGLPHLSYVNVGDTQVTAKCVDSLAQLPALRGLNLSGTAVDDSAVPYLLAMKHLGEGSLSGTRLSGAALLELDDSRPQLEVDAETADCSDMRFDGAKGELTFKQLTTRMQNLNDEDRLKLVDLSGTQITDQHLLSLYGLNNLEMLDIRNTRVSDEGVKSLSAAIPNCQVRR
jgi:Leucine Rich Repeat (LRR) protein